jgi:dTDP-glucose 4,6-dehydratase
LGDKPLPIFGDGKQQRNWIHVEDNCRGILTVLERGRVGKVYNIGGMDVVDNIVMARRLVQLLGKPETLLSFVKDRPGHDRRYALNCQKIQEELGWKCLIPLEDGLRQTIQWYQSNSDWLDEVRRGEYWSYYENNYENREAALEAIVQTKPKNLQ